MAVFHNRSTTGFANPESKFGSNCEIEKILAMIGGKSQANIPRRLIDFLLPTRNPTLIVRIVYEIAKNGSDYCLSFMSLIAKPLRQLGKLSGYCSVSAWRVWPGFSFSGSDKAHLSFCRIVPSRKSSSANSCTSLTLFVQLV
jgi:hypothetical protein